MKKKKKKKKAKSNPKENRKKLLLDTSIQIKKITRPSIQKLIERLKSDYDVNSSFFVLYEFKSGLIRNLIEFYFAVKVYNTIEEAIDYWSDKFQKRELKNKLLLDAVMVKINDSINTRNKDEYLAQLETAIFYIISSFKTDIKNMVGNFQNDEIVKFKITGRDDYDKFLETYSNRKYIPLDKFWTINLKELDKLLADKSKFNTEDYEKVYEHLVKIKNDCENANKIATNKKIGDVVIAVDCPQSYIIVSLDNFFQILCKIVGKKLFIVGRDGSLLFC